MRFHCASCSSFHRPRTAQRDAGVRRRACHLGINHAHAAQRVRRIMDEMPVGEIAVLVGRILSHRRHDHPVGDLQFAQLEGREHRRRPGLAHVDAGFLIVALVPGGIGLFDEARVTQDQIVISDRFRPAHDHHGELHRVHVPGAAHVFEPGQRHVGIVLNDLAGCTAFVIVGLEGRLDRLLGMFQNGVGQGDAAFHRQLGAGADGKMRRGLGVAENDNVFVIPLLAEDARELAPVGAVQQQLVTLQLVGVDLRQLVARAFLVEFFETVTLPAGLIHLEHPGRGIGLILVGMRTDDAVLGHAEEIVEFVHRTGRAHPAESVGLVRDRWLEMLGKVIADGGVDAVGRENDIGIGKLLLNLRRIDAGRKVHRDVEFAAALLQNLQQGEARRAAKTIAGAADFLALEVDGDVIPVGEMISDLFVGLRVA